jgi:hypothetical protein
MTIVRVKGFKIFRDRHGRWRCYHRKTKTPIDLTKAPLGSVEFVAECARIAALITATTPKPGTLGLLIAAYRDHPAFRDLAARTRADYQGVFDYLKPIADTPLVQFDRPLVVRIRDKAASSHGRKFGNDVKARLSTLFGWGAERGYLSGNPATGIKDIRRPKGMPDANRPWADEEREAVLAAAPAHIKPAIALMMFPWPPVDVERFPGFLAAPAAAFGGGGSGRSRSNLVRPPAHGRGDPPGDRMRRAHDRRRTGAEDNRDGPPLRQGRRSTAEDARRGEIVRGRAEQSANKNCQTRGMNVSNLTKAENHQSQKASAIKALPGRSGGTRTPNPRFWRPVL